MPGRSEVSPAYRFLVLACVVAVLGLSGTPATAQSTRQQEIDLCTAELKARYGVAETGQATRKRRNNRRWVTVQVVMADGSTSSFRCQVRYGKLRSVERYTGRWNTAQPVAAAPVEDDAEQEDSAETEAEAPSEPAAPVANKPAVYRVDWGEPFSPNEGITCYKKRRACFTEDDKLDLFWTAKEFPSG